MRANTVALPDKFAPYSIRAQIPTTGTVYGDIVPVVTTLYMSSEVGEQNAERGFRGFSPIGGLIENLIGRIAWADERLRGLAWYFMHAGLGGAGSGKGRWWPASEVFSPAVYSRLFARSLERSNNATMTFWDYWSNGWI